MSNVSVSPHKYQPLTFIDWFFPKNGRCKRCRLPRSAHPIHNFWPPARAIGDKSKPQLTWENLHGPDQESSGPT